MLTDNLLLNVFEIICNPDFTHLPFLFYIGFLNFFIPYCIIVTSNYFLLVWVTHQLPT